MSEPDDIFKDTNLEHGDKDEIDILHELRDCQAYHILPLEEAKELKSIFFGILQQNGEDIIAAIKLKTWKKALKNDPGLKWNEIVYGTNRYKNRSDKKNHDN